MPISRSSPSACKIPKTFNTEETESGCLSKSAIAIHHLKRICFIKIRTGFYYKYLALLPQCIYDLML
ncbi:MAG TPA: hypothetical protein DEQ39_12025 [Atlantibacter hermannii]|nr:hypothetical protein [Enterobacteriaceae bacterium]HAP83785.1 hypothetical protein [Enterobacteriaceae bacterium]HCC11583.1 hypothetical protein [Atlantibacter hermannii]